MERCDEKDDGRGGDDGAVISGCSASHNLVGLQERLGEEFSWEALAAPGSEEQESEPLKRPLRLAVAPPMGEWRRGWSQEEREEIRKWGADLEKAGVVREVVFIPELLVEHGHEKGLENFMEAARRCEADAVLVTRSASDVDSYLNPLSVAYLTVVGLWIIPGSSCESLTLMEGVLMGTRTRKIHATAMGEGRGSECSAWAYMESTHARKRSREAALKAFGVEFVKEAGKLSDR